MKKLDVVAVRAAGATILVSCVSLVMCLLGHSWLIIYHPTLECTAFSGLFKVGCPEESSCDSVYEMEMPIKHHVRYSVTVAITISAFCALASSLLLIASTTTDCCYFQRLRRMGSCFSFFAAGSNCLGVLVYMGVYFNTVYLQLPKSLDGLDSMLGIDFYWALGGLGCSISAIILLNIPAPKKLK